jgi:hypothetical protein
MAAFGALATGVPGIDNDHRDAVHDRLVLDIGTQLREGPVVQCGPLAATGRYPVTDSLEVLKGNGAAGAFRLLHNAFTDAVVHVLLITTLFTGKFAKRALRCARFLSLKIASPVVVGLTLFLYGGPGMSFAVAVEGEIGNSKINAKNTIGVDFLGIRNITDAGNVPLIPDKHQIHFAFPMLQEFSLPVSTDERDDFSAIEEPNRYRVIAFEAKYAAVVRLSGVTAKLSDRARSSYFIGVGDLRDTAHGDLGWESEIFASLLVYQLLQRELLNCIGLMPSLADPITRLIAFPQRYAEHPRLFGCWFQLDIGDQFHVVKYREVGIPCQLL